MSRMQPDCHRIAAAVWLLNGLWACLLVSRPTYAQFDLASPVVSVASPASDHNSSWSEPRHTAGSQQLPPVATGQDGVAGDPADWAGQLQRLQANQDTLSQRIDAVVRQNELLLTEPQAVKHAAQAITQPIEASSAVSDRALQSLFDESGFRFETPDGRFRLVANGQVQVDSRVFSQEDQDPVNTGFYLPRSRIYFSGRLTPPIEYQISVQRGFNSLNLLNSYVRFNYDKRMKLTIGRFKTPYTYDFYKYSNWELLSPERSLFNVNFALNRMVGMMASGECCHELLDYAVGVFNGPRNSFGDENSAKDIVAFLNARPFLGPDGQNFNVGGSVSYGLQDNPLNPIVLRTSTNATTLGLNTDTPVNRANVPFLAFNEGVRELGGATCGNCILHCIGAR